MCIFIIMSNLSKLTDKEKKIVKIIVNNFSLESLKEEIELFIIPEPVLKCKNKAIC